MAELAEIAAKAETPSSPGLMTELEVVWETEQYYPFRGFGRPLQSAAFTDGRGNKLRAPCAAAATAASEGRAPASSALPNPAAGIPAPPLPRGWRWSPGSAFYVDRSWGPVDADGYTYATTVSGLREQVLTGNACGVKHANHFFRRRRWVRPRVCASRRVRRETRRHLRSIAADKARAEWLLREKEGWYQAARAFELERRARVRAARRDVRLAAMSTDYRAEGGVRFLREMGSFLKEKSAVDAEFAGNMAHFVARQRAAEAKAAAAHLSVLPSPPQVPAAIVTPLPPAPLAASAAAAMAVAGSAGAVKGGEDGSNAAVEETAAATAVTAAAADAAVPDGSADAHFEPLPPSDADGSGVGERSSKAVVMEAIENAVLGSRQASSGPPAASAAASGVGGVMGAVMSGAPAFPPHESFFGPWTTVALSMYESVSMLTGSFSQVISAELFRDVQALYMEYVAVRQAMSAEVAGLWSAAKSAEDATQEAFSRTEEAFSGCCAAAALSIQRLTDALRSSDGSGAADVASGGGVSGMGGSRGGGGGSGGGSGDGSGGNGGAAGERADVWVEEQRYRAILAEARAAAWRLGSRVAALAATTELLEARRAALAQRVRRVLLLEEERVAADVSNLIATYRQEVLVPTEAGAAAAQTGTAGETAAGETAAGTVAAGAPARSAEEAGPEGGEKADGEGGSAATVTKDAVPAAAPLPAVFKAEEPWAVEPPPSILAASQGLVEMRGADGMWRVAVAVVTRDQFLHLFEAPAAAVNAAVSAAETAAAAADSASAVTIYAASSATGAAAGDGAADDLDGKAAVESNGEGSSEGEESVAVAAAANGDDVVDGGGGGSVETVDVSAAWAGGKPALSMDVGALATVGGGEGVYEVVGVVGKPGVSAGGLSAFGKRYLISAKVVLRSAPGGVPIDHWIQSIRTPSAGMDGADAAAAAATAASGPPGAGGGGDDSSGDDGDDGDDSSDAILPDTFEDDASNEPAGGATTEEEEDDHGGSGGGDADDDDDDEEEEVDFSVADSSSTDAESNLKDAGEPASGEAAVAAVVVAEEVSAFSEPAAAAEGEPAAAAEGEPAAATAAAEDGAGGGSGGSDGAEGGEEVTPEL